MQQVTAPTCLYLRGAPGSGKHTVARILERDLGWPRLWVHHFDAVYRAIGDYKVPNLTDELMLPVCVHLMLKKKNLIVVRPSRNINLMIDVSSHAESYGHRFVPVRLTAKYDTLVTRVTRRAVGNESPFRLTTRTALDEYLKDRPEENWIGETVVPTDLMTPEQVAGRIKELLPT